MLKIKITLLAVIFSLCGVISAHAQQVLGQTIRHLPPFEDPEIAAYMEKILYQMDAFHADSSIQYIGEALQKINPDKDREELYFLLSYRAEVLYYEGLFNEAMRDLDRCMLLAHNLNDSLLVANIYNLKGLLYENIEESEGALSQLSKALEYYPKEPAARYPITELHHIFGNMGSYLTKIQVYDTAHVCLQQSLELAKRAHAPRAIAVAQFSLGELALKTNQADAALRYFEAALVEALAATDYDVALDAYIGKAEASASLGDFVQAKKYITESNLHLGIYEAQIGMVTQRNHAKRTSQLYKQMNDLSAALFHLGEWRHFDSLIQSRNVQSALTTQAALLQSNANLELERLSLQQKEEELENFKFNQRILIASSALVILFLLFIYQAIRVRRRNEKRFAALELSKLQQEKIIAELQIREQVGRDMHDDLGAGLSALKLKSEMAIRTEKDSEKRNQLKTIADTAGELIDSMRQIIWSMNVDQTNLDDLVVYALSYARNYLSDNNIDLHIHADSVWPEIELSAQQRRNIFLIIKEALHNIVKHSGANQVEIRAKWMNGLELSIHDNGVGNASSETIVGNGMKNMCRRTTDLGGEIKFTVEKGMNIDIVFPLHGNKSSIV